MQVGGVGVEEAVAPCSTFKIALSLMGFDSGILVDEENPVWAEWQDDEFREVCRQELNPMTWMRNSCIWYSQSLTRRLGMERFADYVTAFQYGNGDVSGGLERAWLNTSLKISCVEQIEFLRKMVEGQLDVSDEALEMTRRLLFIEELGNSWKLFGKTGAWFAHHPDGSPDALAQLGWFVGWVERDGERFFFALNMRRVSEVPSVAARWQIVKDYLKDSGVLNG
jgi:beta-lactamase class D